jgi:HlyD family secretion protein
MSVGPIVRAWGVILLLVFSFAGCSGPQKTASASAPPVVTATKSAPEGDFVRSTGLVQALQSYTVRVPQTYQQGSGGMGGRVTLVKLISNGSAVKKDDILVEFDRAQIQDQQIEAKAKLDDLVHQAEEKQAQAESDAAKRAAAIREAEADLLKAQLQLKKGSILSDIDRLKNEEKESNAKQRVASLNKSDALRHKAEAAGIRIAELKAERQRLVLKRIENNLEKLVIKSPQDGMVALENVWRSGSMGPPQEGDQLWPGSPVLRVFDPSRMIVETLINEPDRAVLGQTAAAKVFLDAYPGTQFDAELETTSPVATAGLDSPVRTFTARFRILQQDPRLLPDLSAALEIPLAQVVPANAPKQVAQKVAKP